MWRKYRRIKKQRLMKHWFLYICLAVIIILLILYRWNLILSKSNFDINDLESLLYRLKKNYKNSLTRISNQSLKIGILVVSDKPSQLNYSQLSDALNCYSIMHGYIFRNLDPSSYSLCSYISNFFFRKHCCVLLYLIKHSEIGWLMVLDGDNVLVNTTKRIEDYIPNLPNVYIVHGERFYNGEISAGNYLIYNCRWSYLYLYNWMNMYQILPKLPYHNNDNGALHIHFALSIGKLSSTCFNLWYKSVDEALYDQYVGCIKCLIGGQRRFDHIWLLRRGHAFTRDYREPPNTILENDFIIHGFKNDSSHYYQTKINISICQYNINQWSLPIRREIIISNRTIAQQLIRYHDFDAQEKHPDSVGIPDVFDCWPFCQHNLTGDKEKQYLQTLCKNDTVKPILMNASLK